ncbi:PAS domain-containing protein [Natronomonas salsuginis]|uniref:PAS domain-containing protein n=1 Tax=Natronomonas salsuginis TaxID=2217661 RepID=UPI001C9E3DC7|nr:PAS domain-containing protein [Natronomonas salsuginis]
MLDARAIRADRRTVRVLHVDDNRSILDLTAAFPDRELADVSVTSETTPDDALSRLETESFDCVVSEYEMSGRSGLELFEAIREDHPLLPFVLYTGKGSEEIASQAVNAGVTGYFQKGGPDQQRRLANRVRQAAEKYHTRIEADRYSTVLRALDYPIYVVDETGVFSYVNDAMVELTGYEREEIIGASTDIIKDDEAVAAAERELGDILSHEGPDTTQFYVDVVPKDGDPIPCRDHMAVLPYEGEEFRGSVGILRNVCEEVSREETLERRERELERKTRAMDEAPVGITITDPSREDNPMIYVNGRFVEMTGYPRSDSIDENCRFLQGPETDEQSVNELRQAIDTGEATTVEIKNYRRDGEPFWNRVSISPLLSEDGEAESWVGFQRDITAYKNRERELERQNDRLERFAGIVSHDLRSPMSVAAGRIELAKAEGEADRAANLDAALDALDRMDTIVDDTLTLARQGDTVGEPETVSLSSVAEECWRTTETDDGSIEVAGDLRFRADPDRLRNLVENLLGNAIEHGGERVTVRIGALDDGFYIADDGPGIDEAERESVFDPGHTSAEDGTGFGLAIVNEIAEAHGWTVSIGDAEVGGARFEIRDVTTV